MNQKIIPTLKDKDIVRFIKYIDFLGNDSCWLWVGSKNKGGYGEFGLQDYEYLAHRVSYEFFEKKKIPEDMTIDHLCRTKLCVNPKHFEVVTRLKNCCRKLHHPKK